GDGCGWRFTGAARATRSARPRARRPVLLGCVRTGAPRRILSSVEVMKIAILGTRGIPASYSGFETAVEQLASRLTERGHEVVVYCRPHVVDRRLQTYKGARLVHL